MNRNVILWPNRTRDRSRPVVVRRVTKMGRDNRPKVAEDRRLELTVERVAGQQTYPCGYYKCEQLIVTGEEHAVLGRPGAGPFIRGRRLPSKTRYHFDCLPPEARPLARFFRA